MASLASPTAGGDGILLALFSTWNAVVFASHKDRRQ